MSAALDVATRGTSRASSGGLRAVGAAARSATVWVVAAIVVLLAAIVGFVLSTGGEDTRPLHWESTEPDGGRAFVEVLRSRGVDVTTTESYDEARRMAAETGTTLLVHDSDTVLGTVERRDLARASAAGDGELVVAGGQDGFDGYTDSVSPAHSTVDAVDHSEPMPADCSWDVAQRAGAVTGSDAPRWSSNGTSEGTVTVCYHHPWDQPGYGTVVREEFDDHGLTLLSDSSPLSNAQLDADGNAALVLGALGKQERVVYYYPSADDESRSADGGDGGASTLDLVPRWFGVAFLWLFPLLLVVMLWRGRRLGPLALERLPVIVPPVETVIGRAGIMQRSGARLEALRSLRTASLLRMARRLALPPDARSDRICDAVAAHTGRDPAEVRYALLEAVPASDRQLADISTLISTIESEVSPL